MSFKESLNEHKVIIIIVVLLIIIWLIYRYYWKNRSVSRDFQMVNPQNNLLNSGPTLQSLGLPAVNATNGVNAVNAVNNDLSKHCLDPAAQEKIAAEIKKKLDEINACDCSAQPVGQTNYAAVPVVNSNQPIINPTNHIVDHNINHQASNNIPTVPTGIDHGNTYASVEPFGCSSCGK